MIFIVFSPFFFCVDKEKEIVKVICKRNRNFMQNFPHRNHQSVSLKMEEKPSETNLSIEEKVLRKSQHKVKWFSSRMSR